MKRKCRYRCFNFAENGMYFIVLHFIDCIQTSFSQLGIGHNIGQFRWNRSMTFVVLILNKQNKDLIFEKKNCILVDRKDNVPIEKSSM